MFDVHAEFPESWYIPSEANTTEYLDGINIGSKIASESSVYIAGLARDCADCLPYTLARIDKLRSFFRSSRVVIVENDSVDGTSQILKTWEQNSRSVKVISQKLNIERGPQDYSLSRRERMATCRNVYLDGASSQYDYTIILDTDINGGFSYHGILNSLSYEFACMGANSILYRKDKQGKIERLYYDTWALRTIDDDGEIEYSPEKAERLNRMRFDRGDLPIEVLSCFGGVAIYKSDAISGLRYAAYDIDHATLADGIRVRGGKIYLNPSLIALYNSTYLTPSLESEL